jgi:hypothetical protein
VTDMNNRQPNFNSISSALASVHVPMHHYLPASLKTAAKEGKKYIPIKHFLPTPAMIKQYNSNSEYSNVSEEKQIHMQGDTMVLKTKLSKLNEQDITGMEQFSMIWLGVIIPVVCQDNLEREHDYVLFLSEICAILMKFNFSRVFRYIECVRRMKIMIDSDNHKLAGFYDPAWSSTIEAPATISLFQSSASVIPGQPHLAPASQNNLNYNNASDVCRHFNTTKGCYRGTNCTFQHACSYCAGEHSITSCTSSGNTITPKEPSAARHGTGRARGTSSSRGRGSRAFARGQGRAATGSSNNNTTVTFTGIKKENDQE